MNPISQRLSSGASCDRVAQELRIAARDESMASAHAHRPGH